MKQSTDVSHRVNSHAQVFYIQSDPHNLLEAVNQLTLAGLSSFIVL